MPKHAFNKTIWLLKESKIIPMANSRGLNQVFFLISKKEYY